MKARELVERLLRDIDSGRISPDAVVVTPFCMCDEDTGYVEAQFLDVVERKRIPPQSPLPPESPPEAQLYEKRNVDPGPDTDTTLKLG